MNLSAIPVEIERKLIKGLREKGYKLTSQRLEIISLLARDRSHPGGGDIFRKVRKVCRDKHFRSVLHAGYAEKRKEYIV
jgi:Fe2+ or Zn2+ uptake regulation protein